MKIYTMQEITLIRKVLNISVSEFANMLDISRQTLNNYENGIIEPKKYKLISMSVILDDIAKERNFDIEEYLVFIKIASKEFKKRFPKLKEKFKG